MAERDNQSYLSRLSPWTRNPPPQQTQDRQDGQSVKPQKAKDHVVTHRHRLSLQHYPRDCPPLRPQWFHAIDIPKRRPNAAGTKEEKTSARPKKYAPFLVKDSKAIEAAFVKLRDEEHGTGFETEFGSDRDVDITNARKARDKKEVEESEQHKPGGIRVPVNEDYLFDVDIERRELAPAYWLGPVYDVRRGTWFYQDGSVQRPCDENLATQLEEGYLKVKAWRLKPPQTELKKQRSSSQPRERPSSWAFSRADNEKPRPLTPQSSNADLRLRADRDMDQIDGSSIMHQPADEQLQNTHQLFGAHLGSVVTYQDATTAWLQTDDFMSRMNYSMYSRFAGGGHFGGTKVTRGYKHVSKKSEDTETRTDAGKETKDQIDTTSTDPLQITESVDTAVETRRQTLQRQMSSLLDESENSKAVHEEEMRKRDEREIEEDYRDAEGDQQDREIDHLILVTHGIGQRLSLRIESVNFVHDVNTLRKTIKAVYADSPDLRALNNELDKAERTNSRIQVLPICWRHLLDFPKRSLKHNRREHDLGDNDIDDDDYPSLDDISVEGVPAVRNLITDLALDILLYQSPAYRDHISRVVLEECNRIYNLFMSRNANFNGKVSFIGHSLGSAIMFDLLCQQDTAAQHHRHHQPQLKLDFDVEEFYALGSPIALFQMLKGRKVAARETNESKHLPISTSMDDPMFDGFAKKHALGSGGEVDDIPASRPKCAQLYNIFHPTDPIAYRLEPLISPLMASLKPQPLPYTKRGIFGAPMGQGLTGIGARVSQSVSSMWSSMASSLLTRGLGYTGNEPNEMPDAKVGAKSSAPLSFGAGTNIAANDAVSAGSVVPESAAKIKSNAVNQDQVARDVSTGTDNGTRAPTLIDGEIETLYSNFQTQRKTLDGDAQTRDLGAGPLGDKSEWQSAEERGRKLRREEGKLRQLNSNGRVDYAIQEGVFDINLIAAIASHLSYWSDEDVCHFIISQLLSRHRDVRSDQASAARTP